MSGPFHLLLLMTILVTPVAAATTDTPSPSGASHACALIADADERLKCYDTAFPLKAKTSPVPVSPQPAQDKAQTEFGLNKLQRQRNSGIEPESAPTQIEGIVSAVEMQRTGRRLVLLESGHSWLLTEVTSKGAIAAGDRVVIRKAALGSFMLVTQSGVPLRARRIN
jgi:hypothetical protein